MVTIMTSRWIYTLLGTVQSNNYTKKSWGEYTDCACVRACVRARRTGKTLTDCMCVCVRARVRACVHACPSYRKDSHRLRVCVRACPSYRKHSQSCPEESVSTESAKDGLSVTQIKTQEVLQRQLAELIHQDTRGDDRSGHNTLSASDYLKTQNKTRNGEGKG